LGKEDDRPDTLVLQVAVECDEQQLDGFVLAGLRHGLRAGVQDDELRPQCADPMRQPLLVIGKVECSTVGIEPEHTRAIEPALDHVVAENDGVFFGLLDIDDEHRSDQLRDLEVPTDRPAGRDLARDLAGERRLTSPASPTTIQEAIPYG
jgi:hypothetical protein